jgi:hypothetical protein
MEIFDPDTINRSTHRFEQPSELVYTQRTGRAERGAWTRSAPGPPNGNIGHESRPSSRPAPRRPSSRIRDKNGQQIALATYGPSSNTPFWRSPRRREFAAEHGEATPTPAQAQIARPEVDHAAGLRVRHALHPQAVLDPGAHRVRLELKLATCAHRRTARANGQVFIPTCTASRPPRPWRCNARGRIPINFRHQRSHQDPIGNAEAAKQVWSPTFD